MFILREVGDFEAIPMWWRASYKQTAYDDDWEDQPAQSSVHKWVLGLFGPALLLSYGIWVLVTKAAEFSGDRATMDLRGENAIAYGLAVISIALFLHCHYFWGNIYNQIWFAVLGKIVSACGFIAAAVFLCIHIGILGRN